MKTQNTSIEELVDIRNVHIDPSKPLNEKMQGYIKQIKNPYCFRYKEIVLTLEFVGNDTFEDKIVEFLQQKEV